MVTFVSTVLHQIQTVPVQIQAQVHTTGQQRLKRIISPVDFNKVAKTVGAEKLPVILFREEPNLAITKLQKFTTKLGVSVVCICVNRGKCYIYIALSPSELLALSRASELFV